MIIPVFCSWLIGLLLFIEGRNKKGSEKRISQAAICNSTLIHLLEYHLELMGAR